MITSPDGQWIWNGDEWVPSLPSNPPPLFPPPRLDKPISPNYSPSNMSNTSSAPTLPPTYVSPSLPSTSPVPTLPSCYPSSSLPKPSLAYSPEPEKPPQEIEKMRFADYISGTFSILIIISLVALVFGIINDLPTKTDNLEYEHIEVQVYSNDWWCYSNIDNYCHQISFLITNENILWTFVPDNGNWTVITSAGLTLQSANADVDNREASPQQTTRYDLEFPVSQNDRIVKLNWTSEDLKFSVDLPTY